MKQRLPGSVGCRSAKNTMPLRRRRRAGSLLIGLAAALVATGCSDAEPEATPEVASLASDTTTTLAGDADDTTGDAAADGDTGPTDEAEPSTAEGESASGALADETDPERDDEAPSDTEADENSDVDPQDTLNDFSGCMRSEGLSDFPDLELGAGAAQQVLDAGIDPLGREFGAALAACRDLLADLQQAPSELSPEQRLTAEQALLAGSVCMRNKGITNFPDPDFTQGLDQRAYVGGILAAGIDLLDPAFQTASSECQREVAEEFDLDGQAGNGGGS